jgi:hypothetical protein
MRAVVSRYGARAISLTLVAGMILLGALFVRGAGTAVIGGATGLADETDGAPEADPGGETVVTKLARRGLFARKPVGPEPTPASRLLAMALAPLPAAISPRKAEAGSKEPNLKGLSEIPPELIWNRPPKKDDDEAEPKAFAAFSKAREVLPWDAVEPVPFTPLGPASKAPGVNAAAAEPAGVPRALLDLPAGGEVGTWVKAKVTEIKGADRSRPLYHFEVWLEPPAEVTRRLVGVAYAFSTPAIRPQTQASSDKTSGFRISAGGLACADEIILTLRFDDGRSQKVAVDGCALLS